jgi:hypothetical protein
MEDTTPGGQLSEEPQSERGETGSRDTGSEPSGGPTDRPEGAVPQESVPSHGGTEEAQYGGTGTLPPQGSEPAVPPYEGRQTSAKPTGEGAEAGVKPVESSSYKASAPGSTQGGATASPGDHQPAAEQPETDLDDDRVGPAHTTGTTRGEDRL